MKSNIKKYLFVVVIIFMTTTVFSQRDTNKWKAQIGLGVNSPSQSGFVDDFQGKSLNFPTVNLGIQHMFKQQLGAKLDFGFNRIASEPNTPDFKLNYTRVNAQFVFDATGTLAFLPQRMGIVAHTGPGLTFIKPLGNYGNNDLSFLNAMAGLEIHYGLAERLSIYVDTSYILGFAKDFDPLSDGFGSFNGNLMTINLGLTFSLSGCQYCNNE